MAASNQCDLTTKHVLDSYNKYKKETQVIVGISAIPIGQRRMTNQDLAGGVPYALIPLWYFNSGVVSMLISRVSVF